MNKRICAFCMIIIVCFTLNAQDNGEKPIIAVLDFEANDISNQEMKSIISLISSALFQTGNYKVIDVSQRETLLDELKFSASGCSDEACMLEIGKMLSAENIVTGSIGMVGSRIVLNAKILETQSSETISSADGIYTDLDALIDNMYQFIAKLDYLSDSTATVTVPQAEILPEIEKRPFPILFASTLSGGIISAGVGAYFLISSLPLMIDYWNAQNDYNNATSGDITADYDAYEAARVAAVDENASNRFIIGSVLAGAGLILGGVSFLFLPKSGSAVEVSVETRPDTLAFRVRY
ncbi:MAG: hypothetical protein JEY99_21350 [Spirochaetales bacterium]|nr:hypothetical protein [Spirochaetales bacterium]